MKKKILLLMGIFSIGLILHAQIGINTDSPQALFHAKGTVTDMVVTPDGRTGIGTISPSNKLSIVSTGSNTGLQLLNGRTSGSTLQSDAAGNAIWNPGKVQYQTMVEGTDKETTYTNAAGAGNAKQVKFFKVVFDKVKDIYGTAYGWDNANQHYVVPVTGVYRIAYAAYFWPETRGVKGKNPRAYIFRNSALFPTPGIISVTDAGEEVIGYTMGLASLNKGDIIDMRVCVHSSSTGVVTLYGGTGHTFLLIESL